MSSEDENNSIKDEMIRNDTLGGSHNEELELRFVGKQDSSGENVLRCMEVNN